MMNVSKKNAAQRVTMVPVSKTTPVTIIKQKKNQSKRINHY